MLTGPAADHASQRTGRAGGPGNPAQRAPPNNRNTCPRIVGGPRTKLDTLVDL